MILLTRIYIVRGSIYMFVWSGPRESDINYTDGFFRKSITLYGTDEKTSFCSKKNHRINHNNVTKEQTDFVVSKQKELMNDNNVYFMSYNPNLVFGSDPWVVSRTVCMNDESLMKFLDSKISFREFASKHVTTLQSDLFYGEECTFFNLSSKLNTGQVIIQGESGSGGYQTFLMNQNNASDITAMLTSNQKYLVSPYYENNIPINIHAIIYPDQILLTPGSVQIMENDYTRLLYRGADFITYRSIDISIRKDFEDDVITLCEEIRKMGYKGVLGIDAIVVDNKPKILEINNRFQASTILINKALCEKGFCSVQELNYESFNRECSSLISAEELKNLEINYSIYTYINTKSKYHYSNILNSYQNANEVVELIDDGYIEAQECEDEAYLFRLIFNTNIASIAEDKYIRIHPNLCEPDYDWYQKILNGDFKRTKISLLNQGVVLENEVKDFLKEKGGMQPGVYYAVDLSINDEYIVNSPLYVRFASLSPFRVRLFNGKLYLYYYDTQLYEVKIQYADKFSKYKTTSGVSIDKICLLATDRLRIQNSCFCTFKEQHIPCRFCEAKYKSQNFDINDIKEAVNLYFEKNSQNFRHILIGGLSNEIGKEKNNIVEIIKTIRYYSNMPIYLMSLPSVNTSDIEEYVKLGVTEIGYNLEIFDRNLAKKYMPGKGNISLSRYEKALRKAVELLGNTGAVRSAFVIGLESLESLLSGVEYLCSLGVAPILSVFRPIPYTETQNLNPPSNQWLFDAYEKAEKICKKYNLSLGPSCASCQNNTLSFDRLDEGNTHGKTTN